MRIGGYFESAFYCMMQSIQDSLDLSQRLLLI